VQIMLADAAPRAGGVVYDVDMHLETL